MESKYGFVKMTVPEFSDWLNNRKITRKISCIQMHHTWLPNYTTWNKNKNHFAVQQGMKESHLSRGFCDIAQHFTIFPDGYIVTGRSMNSMPSGIKGANTGAVCIENLGNFDIGNDEMSNPQKESIIAVTAILLKSFGLGTNAVTYHAWWTASGKKLGDYKTGQSAKTCPGTNFFGGNTYAAFNKNFKIRIEKYFNKEDEPDMEQLKRLEEKVNNLTMIINKLSEKIEKNEIVIYDYIDKNMPDWAREAVRTAVNKGALLGDEEGRLGLTDSDLRTIVREYRMGMYK